MENMCDMTVMFEILCCAVEVLIAEVIRISVSQQG